MSTEYVPEAGSVQMSTHGGPARARGLPGGPIHAPGLPGGSPRLCQLMSATVHVLAVPREWMVSAPHSPGAAFVMRPPLLTGWTI